MITCIFYVYILTMFNSCLNKFSSRRKRITILKVVGVILVIILFYLWITNLKDLTNVGDNKDDSRPRRFSFPKAEGQGSLNKIHAAEFNGNNIGDEWSGGGGGTGNTDDFEHHDDSKRRIIEEENIDEFLVPVLEKYKYIEVDLIEKSKVSHDDYDEEIQEDIIKLNPALGQGGEKAFVPEFQKAVAEEIKKKEAFNRLLSDMISPNRTVPDTREKTCIKLKYDKKLPDASIVIIYTGEAYSTLVRTIHSVINRTPSHLLREIVLVDDFSDRRDLKGKLERYLATKFPKDKIRLVKLLQRSGLIRARMIGAHLATGDVLVFLDAHCETGPAWLEPMLQRIKEDRKAVVCPIIDVIDDKTLEYYHGNGAFFQIGGFTWSGHFTWVNIPPYESARKEFHHSPTRSPTMAGGLFAIDRRYFWQIGSYDSEMQLWGGENLEMSFRVWQCGGSVEIIPCSRVGHVFRDFHPYSFPGNVDSHGLNTARLVEVWMDEFKEIFYSHRPELKTADIGDLSKRRDFRKRMNCKSFDWYLNNIYKEKFKLHFGSKYYGQVKNKGTTQCLDNMQHSDTEEYTLSSYPCHTQLYPSQTFYLSYPDPSNPTDSYHLRREYECASLKTGNEVIDMLQCDHVHDTWKLQNELLIHEKSNKCLTITLENTKNNVQLKDCTSSPNQKWTINNFKTNKNLS